MLKSSFVIIALMSLIHIGTSQTTFTVNETSLGVGTAGGVVGSLDTDGSLDVMMTNAMLSANAGNEVTINLNASGLVLVTSNLPVITISNSAGKLTIQKYPTAAVVQGIKKSDDLAEIGFKVYSCAGDVEIKNLKIEDFLSGIILNGHADAPGDILINNNHLYLNETAIYASLLEFDQVDLVDNVIEGTAYTELETWGIHVALIGESTDYSNAEFMVEGNSISEVRHGIQFFHKETYIKNKANVTVTNNSLATCYNGIRFVNPNELFYELSENDLVEMNNFGLIIAASDDPNDNEYSIFPCNFKLIEPGNSLGLPAKNNGNTYEECLAGSIWLDKVDTITIVGLDVQGAIVGNEGLPYTVRETLISSPTDFVGSFSYPINWDLASTNSGIPSPTPLSATTEDDNLTLVYNLPDLFDINSSFEIEFFVTNADNSLISFLGRDTKMDASSGPHIRTFSDIVFAEGSRIGMTVTSIGGQKIGTSEVAFIDPTPTTCDGCYSFKPEPGERYWVSAWVKEDHLEQVKTFEDANLELSFVRLVSSYSVQFYPTGDIIDGWQRIVGEFIMPTGVLELVFLMNASDIVDTYFDDIRIHPYNGSMKSYVYDGETFWLTSELDDNNYATFYEYDEEGGLIRIKKETSEGIVTIQETRSNTIKIVE